MDLYLSRRKFLEASLRASPGLVGSLFVAPKVGTLSALPFKLGIITDEIADDLEKALDFISSYSLHWCELRELWQKNIMNLGQADLERARALIQEHHLQVSDIASPIFKYNLPEMPAQEEKRDTFRASFTDQDSEHLLQKSFELARFFGTTKVRIFSYWRVGDPSKAYPYVRDRLAKAAEVAGKNGVLLCSRTSPRATSEPARSWVTSCARSTLRICVETGTRLMPPCWTRSPIRTATWRSEGCLPTCT